MTGVRTGRGTSKNHSTLQVRERLLCAPGEQVVLAGPVPVPPRPWDRGVLPGRPRLLGAGEPSSESAGLWPKVGEGLLPDCGVWSSM